MDDNGAYAIIWLKKHAKHGERKTSWAPFQSTPFFPSGDPHGIQGLAASQRATCHETLKKTTKKNTKWHEMIKHLLRNPQKDRTAIFPALLKWIFSASFLLGRRYTPNLVSLMSQLSFFGLPAVFSGVPWGSGKITKPVRKSKPVLQTRRFYTPRFCLATPTQYWLVVWTPLKNMNVHWDDYKPNIYGKIKNVPNHQPE